MKLTLKRTERGFDYAEFIDIYGAKCSIQKSSLATEDCIWLGSDEEPERHQVTGEWLGSRMHLTRDHVKALLPLLKSFADTGELKK